MAEYSSDINTALYKYRQPIYVIERTGERQTYIPLKLSLNYNNFNFDLARSDGRDFRLAESSNGTGVLQMWIAYWNSTDRLATVWFKLPEILGGELKTMYAYWGFEYDSGVSDLRYLLGESTEESIVYTDNLAENVNTSGTAANTLNPEYCFDGLDWTGPYCDLPETGWIQANFPSPTKINKLRIAGDGTGNYGRGFKFRASNDNFVSEDVILYDTDVGQNWTWVEYYFGNNTAYTSYRVTEHRVGTWRISEIQMMGINVAETESTAVFRFGDDFEGNSLDVNKWPTTNGSWSISNSRINLSTDAWIRSPDVLGGQNHTYVGFEYELVPTAGLYGHANNSGNCYLSYTGSLTYTQPELIDPDVTTYNERSFFSSTGGCAIGVDMGTIVDKVSRIRVYLHDKAHAYNGEMAWQSDAYILIYRSDTNVGGEQIFVYNFTPTEAPLHKAQDYVWYFDLNFDAPGISTRYFHLYGRAALDPGINYRCSGMVVYADESSLTTEPGKFLIEDGVIGIGSPSSTSTAAHRYRCYGGENVMGIDYYWEGGTDRRHDFVNAGTYVTYAGTNKGLMEGSYNQTYIGYYEDTDHCYQGMTNRGGEATPVYSEDLITDPDSALASSSNPGHPTAWLPRNAADGSASTQWIAGTVSPTWWGYSFNVGQSISRVVINNGGVSLQALTIEASNSADADWNDKSWTSLFYQPYIPSAVSIHQMDFENPAPYKYWRLRYDFDLSQALVEVEMYTILSYSGEFDYDDSWERKVHRNTEVSNFRIYGEDLSSANGVGIDWVVVRDFTPESDPLVDYSSLYVEYEYVGHQQLDQYQYDTDVTDVNYHHISDMGGDPYRMSDDVVSSLSNIFISDGESTSGNLVIDFGRYRYSITDKNYTHYDSDRISYYNASKLSDLETDVHGRTYWQTTTTSGWAAIRFPETKDLACLALRAVPGQTSRMVNNFKFYGSQSNPRFSGWNDKVLIYEGQALAIEQEQTFYFSTGLTFYKYYILDVLDTHGGNIAIQEWGMYDRNEALGKKVISQLRLHPAVFDNNEYYFVKEIEFYGSNDGFTWDFLIPTTPTPTPFVDYAYGRWSRYSFENFDAYYIYRLACYNNWRAPDDTIKIAEWEMVERVEEVDNIRVLSGSTNNINNIWADPNTTISSGTMYFTNDDFSTVEYDTLIHHSPVYGGIGGGYWQDTDQYAEQTTGGTATESIGPFQGNPVYAAASAFDGSLGTYYHSLEYFTYPIWIQYQFATPQKINYMRMYPRTNYTARMPGDFILKGSNTGAFSGEETDIVSIVGATYSNSQWTEFSFANSSTYLYYRIHITAKAVGSGAGNYMNIFEIEMRGYTQEWVPEYDIEAIADFNIRL